MKKAPLTDKAAPATTWFRVHDFRWEVESVPVLKHSTATVWIWRDTWKGRGWKPTPIATPSVIYFQTVEEAFQFLHERAEKRLCSALKAVRDAERIISEVLPCLKVVPHNE